MKHTPGPWISGAINEGYSVRRPGAGTCVIAIVRNREGLRIRVPEETLANALLIASAPDLLEACKAALSFLEDYDGDLIPRKKLAEAIQKAEATE